MKQTAIQWLANRIIDLEERLRLKEINLNDFIEEKDLLVEQAKEMEKNNIDNKAIHFAEWLTNKHTTTLITLYKHFEEQYYNETFKSE
jgi:hypothetical protein